MKLTTTEQGLLTHTFVLEDLRVRNKPLVNQLVSYSLPINLSVVLMTFPNHGVYRSLRGRPHRRKLPRKPFPTHTWTFCVCHQPIICNCLGTCKIVYRRKDHFYYIPRGLESPLTFLFPVNRVLPRMYRK